VYNAAGEDFPDAATVAAVRAALPAIIALGSSTAVGRLELQSSNDDDEALRDA
jgi:hypothetical protein